MKGANTLDDEYYTAMRISATRVFFRDCQGESSSFTFDHVAESQADHLHLCLVQLQRVSDAHFPHPQLTQNISSIQDSVSYRSLTRTSVIETLYRVSMIIGCEGTIAGARYMYVTCYPLNPLF